MDEINKPQTEVNCGMNLEDLYTFFSAFKGRVDIDQVVYWILKWRISRRLYIEVHTGERLANNEVDNPFLL